jgi:hypothetical protein
VGLPLFLFHCIFVLKLVKVRDTRCLPHLYCLRTVKELDACMMTHPGPGPAHSGSIGGSLAIQVVNVSFHGKTAHAAGAPWSVILLFSVPAIDKADQIECFPCGVLSGRESTLSTLPISPTRASPTFDSRSSRPRGFMVSSSTEVSPRMVGSVPLVPFP